MKFNFKIVAIVVLFVAIIAVVLSFDIGKTKNNTPATFEECVKSGNIVQEIYPRRCVLENGISFTENIGNELEKSDLIRVSYPRPNTVVSSPLIVNGIARGNWYFEASFPVILKDANGKILAQGIATANGDWMTEDFVPFSLELKFDNPEIKSGILIFKKDNPSGDPKFDDELITPVSFEEKINLKNKDNTATSTADKTE